PRLRRARRRPVHGRGARVVRRGARRARRARRGEARPAHQGRRPSRPRPLLPPDPAAAARRRRTPSQKENPVISFGPTEEQEVARDAMREFASSVLRPTARAADEAERVDEEALAQAWQLGLTATQIPEAYGGGGEPRSPVTNAIVLEELAYGDAALALAAVAPSLFAMPVVEFG